MDAEPLQVPECAEVHPIEGGCHQKKEEVVNAEESLHLPVAQRNNELTDEDLEVLTQLAENPPPPPAGWEPATIPVQKRPVVRN